MTENYPTSIDSYPTKVDNVTDVMADDVNTIQVAVVALQTKIGIDSSAIVTSIDYILTDHIADVSNPHSVTQTQVGLSNVENTALSTWTGTANITTVGTIVTGTWDADALLWAKIDTTGSNLTDLTTRSHTDLTDKGTNTHPDIDTHISSTSNPHTVTLEQARTAGNSISGDIDANSNKVVNLATPTADADAVRKDYVDGLISGLDWQESVKDEVNFVTSEPAVPTTGDRYINTATGNSSITTQAVVTDYIYEWNGSSWDETVPDEGFACWIEDIDILKVYNGTNWVSFGSTMTHNNLSGLQGGAAGEYYHLTNTEHGQVSGVDSQGVLTTASPSFVGLTLSGFTQGSVLFAGAGGVVTEDNNNIFFESGKLSIGTNVGMNNIFQAVKSDSVTDINTVGALIAARNTDTTVDNWSGMSWQTKDMAGNTYSGARIMVQFRSHGTAAISADMVFDTRDAGARTEKMRLSANGDLSLGMGQKLTMGSTQWTSALTDNINADSIEDGSTNAIPTLVQETNWTAAYTHVSSDGTSHTYINQDVTSTGTPSFTSVTLTNALSVSSGGTNSTTALNNDRVMVSSGGAMIESATITTAELGLLNGMVSVSTGVADNDKLVTQGYVDDQVSTVDTLQEVFDNGNTITIADTENKKLILTQNDTTNNPNAMDIINAGTGIGISIDQNGDGIGIEIDSEANNSVGMKINVNSTYGDIELTNNRGAVPSSGNAGSIAYYNDELYVRTSSAWVALGSGVGTVTSVAAGNGLDFTTITASGSVIMGTPSTLTSATTNGVTATSHTHAITTGIVDTNIVKINSASVANGEYAKFTAAGLESKTFAEVKTDLSLNNVTNVATSDVAYDATTWNANTDSATKNAIRDKIETVNTAVGLNTTHRSSSGVDHTYIDQNVTTTGTPTFAKVTVDQDTNNKGLIIDSEATTKTNYALDIVTNLGADPAYISCNIADYYKKTDSLDTIGSHIFYRCYSSATTAAPVVYIDQANAGDDQNACTIQNDGTGNGLYINQQGNGYGFHVNNYGTDYAMNITQSGVCASGKSGVLIYSNTIQTGSSSGLFKVRQDSHHSTQPSIEVKNDSQGYGIFIDQLGTAIGLYIDQGGAEAALKADGQIYSTHQNQGTKTAAYTVDWNKGNCQTVTAGGNFTLSFSNGKAGGSYTLILKQDATGSRTVTLPTVTWNNGDTAPTLSTGASDVDIMTFIYDGSVYFGSYSLDHS